MKCALEFYAPEVKAKLTLMEITLQGWQKRVPTTSHSKCPEQKIYLIAYDLFTHGKYDAATGLLFVFN